MKRNEPKQLRMPSDPALEKSVIGACFGEDVTRLSAARALIAEDHFYDEQNRRVWRSLCRLADAGRALTPLELYADLSANREPLELHQLVDYFQGDLWANEKYILRLMELTKRRRLLVRGHNLSMSASDESVPVEEVAATTISGIQSDIDGVAFDEPETVSEIVEAAGGLNKFLEASKGVRTQWLQFNDCTGGLQPGDLILVAARPSMGKTAFALNVCIHAAVSGVPTILYSFEMSRDSIVKRLLSMRTKIRYSDIAGGLLNPAERRCVIEANDWLSALPIRIIGASGRTAMAVRAHAERMHRRSKCGLVALDYIGLVRGSDSAENRNKQLGEICRQLKELASQLQIPALVLAQLNRSTESRNDKRPMMGDLRDCGELEEHADLIALLHRPGYYDRKNAEIQHIAEVIIAKQRNGDTPVIQLEFEKQSGRFKDPEDENGHSNNRFAFAG